MHVLSYLRNDGQKFVLIWEPHYYEQAIEAIVTWHEERLIQWDEAADMIEMCRARMARADISTRCARCK